MRNPTATTSRITHTTRAILAGIGLLAMLAGLALAGSGCGGATGDLNSAGPAPAATPAAATPGNAPESADATSPPADQAGLVGMVMPVTTSTTVLLSLHDRIMAEQGRGEAAGSIPVVSLPVGPADATLDPADLLQPPTTAPGGPAPGQAAPAPGPDGSSAAQPPVIVAGSTTAVVLTDGQTPLQGVWSGTAEQLATFLANDSASTPRFTVPTLELAGYYIRYCAEAGLRADLLWAQMALETGYGAYGGDVSPYQNNFAGIGATGGGAAGATFATAEAGVMAQVAHMVAYVYAESPVVWANATSDPRFDFVNPRGAAVVLSDLNGRWAVPGDSYGQHIEDIARRLNASVK